MDSKLIDRYQDACKLKNCFPRNLKAVNTSVNGVIVYKLSDGEHLGESRISPRIAALNLISNVLLKNYVR